MLGEVVVDVVPAEHREPDDACRREKGQGEDHEPQEHPHREPQQPRQPAHHEPDGRGSGDGTTGNRVTGDVAVAREFRQQQRDGERRDHEHEGRAGRREDESRDVEVADHRLARGEHDAASNPGRQGVTIATPSSCISRWNASAARQVGRRSPRTRAKRPSVIGSFLFVRERRALYRVAAGQVPLYRRPAAALAISPDCCAGCGDL